MLLTHITYNATCAHTYKSTRVYSVCSRVYERSQRPCRRLARYSVYARYACMRICIYICIYSIFPRVARYIHISATATAARLIYSRVLVACPSQCGQLACLCASLAHTRACAFYLSAARACTSTHSNPRRSAATLLSAPCPSRSSSPAPAAHSARKHAPMYIIIYIYIRVCGG